MKYHITTSTHQKAKCQSEIDSIFDKYGLNDIILALSNRCKIEAAIAQVEGRGGDGNKLSSFAKGLANDMLSLKATVTQI